jgi:hypothetical protein
MTAQTPKTTGLSVLPGSSLATQAVPGRDAATRLYDKISVRDWKPSPELDAAMDALAKAAVK